MTFPESNRNKHEDAGHERGAWQKSKDFNSP